MQTEKFTCKTCGANLDIGAAANGVIECPYCRNVWTLAKKETSPAALSYLRMGEHALDTGDFFGAFEAFGKAAQLDGNEPEAHFGMALSEFKVRYLLDISEDKPRLQPICYEVTDKVFSQSVHFAAALERASGEQKREYLKKAREIDDILRKFYVLEKSGLDYDCFICVKVSENADGDGKHKVYTEDSKDADYIYHLLKDKGYKPFYSEYEIRNKHGEDYEAHILYALKKSECMLVVCRNEEYLQTPWVKNEYSRFLKLVNDEEKETDSITFVFYDKPIEKLPGKRGKLQGINFALRSADGEIIDFVERHTPEARAKRVAEAEVKKRADEEQKKEFNEQRRALEEQQRQIAEQLEKLKNVSSAPSAELSDDELFERMERAREERERKKREDGERIAREKAEKKARIARERAEEGRKRQEEINARPLAANSITLSNYDETKFEIEGTELKRYIGNAGAVKIPFGVTSIGYQAFESRIRLKKIIIPDSVNSIEKNAFYHCPKLARINMPDSVIYIGDSAFFMCEKLKNINIPNSVTAIGSNAFTACKSLTSITIPDSLTFIARGAFSQTNLKSVIIPDSVTSIGESAFGNCKNLKNVTIPDSVTHIEVFAFYNCSKLTKINIPNSVTSIGESAFANCKNLKSITIPDSVTSIGESAFANCKRLRKIVIPESVTYIGPTAFVNCAIRRINCRAEHKSEGWEEGWNIIKKRNSIYATKRAKVVWGYKGK